MATLNWQILGRALVLHEGEDDLGRGVGDKADESKKTGNAGARIGCCTIEEQVPEDESFFVHAVLHT